MTDYRETLEGYEHYWSSEPYGDAIREVLAEVERLQKIVETERPSYVRVCKELRESKAEVERLKARPMTVAPAQAGTSEYIRELQAEVERLKVERDDALAKIDAAVERLSRTNPAQTTARWWSE